ncbi:MAG TPA: cupin domain-containing protein [Steroidobacteraceae bacterium]|nr:cupin domain-containing protein [Steroidobacteraceae bacterium]
MNRDRGDVPGADPDADPTDAPLFERIALALQPVELDERHLLDLRLHVLSRAREQATAGTETTRASDAPWIPLNSKVQFKVLRCDAAAGNQTILLRVAAGGTIPRHQHSQQEEFIVLEGECRIGTHRLAAGDMQVAAAGSWHEQVTTDGGTLVLVRGEYPAPEAVRAMLRSGAP